MTSFEVSHDPLWPSLFISHISPIHYVVNYATTLLDLTTSMFYLIFSISSKNGAI